ATDRRRPEGLGIDRHNALAELAGRFSKKLVEPSAEIRNSRRGDNRHFVARAPLCCPQDRAEDHPRVLDRWRARRAGPHHLGRVFEEGARIDANRRRRYHAEIRQYRIAAADARQTVENTTEPFVARDLFERRAWIGDRDEALWHLRRANGLLR